MLSINITKSVANFSIQLDISTDVPALAIYGPSGAGKSLLLAMISGLASPDSGRIVFADRVLFDSKKGVNLPPSRRRVGLVMQHPYLFPHLSVRQNLYFAYQQDNRLGSPKRIIELLDIGKLLERHPANLSGGEKQRVSLGRALLAAPQLLLLDEPLTGLDQALKSRIIPYLKRIRYDLKIPFIYVSHDLSEILELTGQVLLLEGGRSLGLGNFFQVISDPQALAFAERYGMENIMQAQVTLADSLQERCRIRLGTGELLVPLYEKKLRAGDHIYLGIKASDFIICTTTPPELTGYHQLSCTLVEIKQVSGRYLLYLMAPSGDRHKPKAIQLVAEVPLSPARNLVAGQQLRCLINPLALRYISKTSTKPAPKTV